RSRCRNHRRRAGAGSATVARFCALRATDARVAATRSLLRFRTVLGGAHCRRVALVATVIGAGETSVGRIAITDTAILVADVDPELARALARGLTDGSLADGAGSPHLAFAGLGS